MRKVILGALLIISSALQAQEFDRGLAKTIKTEINLNRIARSREPLNLVYDKQKTADSLTLLYYTKYKEETKETSRGVETNYEAINKALSEMSKDKTTTTYNFLILNEDDLAAELRGEMHYEGASYYRITARGITISVIRYNGLLFVTILT
jgi:hypothetical protein